MVTTRRPIAARMVLLVALALIAAPSACMQYRQTAKEITPAGDSADASRGFGKTVWGFLWGGFYAGKPDSAECGDVGLAEVTVRTNPAFFLLTVATVGLVAPKRVEWKCARPNPTGGQMDADTGVDTEPDSVTATSP